MKILRITVINPKLLGNGDNQHPSHAAQMRRDPRRRPYRGGVRRGRVGPMGITWSIRAGRGPFRNVSLGGEHLHHYMWGIGMLAGVGAIAVRGSERQRAHHAVAISYGSGQSLIVDEFALLLDLKDVYWAQQGRVSIDLGVGGIAATGSYFAALPALRALRRDYRRREANDQVKQAATPTCCA